MISIRNPGLLKHASVRNKYVNRAVGFSCEIRPAIRSQMGYSIGRGRLWKTDGSGL